jgi:hypothetical protein
MSIKRKSVRLIKKHQRSKVEKRNSAPAPAEKTESQLRRSMEKTVASWIEAKKMAEVTFGLKNLELDLDGRKTF